MARDDTIVLQTVPNSAVEIALESRPGSGAIWRIAVPPPGAAVEESRAPADNAAPGDTGRQIFLFRAATAGKYEMEFQMLRPWESAIRDTRRVIILVQPTAPGP